MCTIDNCLSPPWSLLSVAKYILSHSLFLVASSRELSQTQSSCSAWMPKKRYQITTCRANKQNPFYDQWPKWPFLPLDICIDSWYRTATTQAPADHSHLSTSHLCWNKIITNSQRSVQRLSSWTTPTCVACIAVIYFPISWAGCKGKLCWGAATSRLIDSPKH